MLQRLGRNLTVSFVESVEIRDHNFALVLNSSGPPATGLDLGPVKVATLPTADGGC